MSTSLVIEAADSSGRWYLLPGAENSYELHVANESDHAVLCKLSLDEPDRDDVDVRDLVGAGFGIASAEDRVSAALALELEGLLLDNYYGAKAMTLLRTLLAAGDATPAVFWHTGGVVAALAALTRGAPS